jgi:DNA-binding transcriptional MocR family regulator
VPAHGAETSGRPRCKHSAASGTLNLAVGHPSAALLPHAVLAAAAEAAALRMRQGGQAAFNLNYGRPAGEAPVLAALAQLLTRQAGGGADADAASAALAGRLFLTNGVSHALDLLCAVLTQPGDCVLVLRPTYFLAAGILRDHGLVIVDTPSDDSGLDVPALTELLEGGVRPRFIYIVPTHANPSGRTLCTASRAALVALAGRFGFFIVADEVYQALTWGDEPVPARMSAWDVSDAPDDEQHFDGDDRPLAARADAAPTPLQPRPGALVCSCSSFTKTLAPGLRLGWVEAPPAVLSRLAQRAYVVSGGGVAPFASMVVLEAMLSGSADAHLTHLTRTYAGRCAVLCDALREQQPNTRWSFMQPRGGYFVWLRLPSDVTPSALVEASKARAVAVLDGARCCSALAGPPAPLTGGVADASAHIRLCFAFLEVDELREAVRRLAAAVADVRSSARL